MVNSDLNSALALFQSLFKAQKGDIYTIVERFILVGVKSKGLMTFTKEEIVDLLKDSFNIEIPFGVIQRCINTHQEVFKYTREKYVVINPMDEEIDKIISEMNENELYRDAISKELIDFVKIKTNSELTEEEKQSVSRLFFNFVIDKDRIESPERKLLITQFIIQKEKDERFQKYLNSIKEGMVIYKGIRYSESPNDTSWENDTDFFLDQEYLFSAFGMNGAFYEKCFFEFYGFVKEINSASNLRGGRKRIRLFYFPETKSEIDAYFAQAVRIRRMQERYCYPKDAMDSILNSCKEDVDVERYKANFYRKLKELCIEEYLEEIDLRKNQDYLLENDQFEKEKEKHFTPDQYGEVNEYVKMADYISILRQGKRCHPLEKCRCIFLSDGNLSNELSRFIREFYSEKRPILITRMGVFTELMWFKLRKGVVGTVNSETISVVNKAKTVVSGLLYDNLKKQYDAVLALDADENEKRAFYAELRSKRYSPDSISSETIAGDVAFIDDPDYLEKYKQAQVELKKEAARSLTLEKDLEKEKEQTRDLKQRINQLEVYLNNDNKRKIRSAISQARRRISPLRWFYKNLVIMVNIMVILGFAIPSYLFMQFIWINTVTVIGSCIAVEGVLNPLLINRRPKRRARFLCRYRRALLKEMDKMGVTGPSDWNLL